MIHILSEFGSIQLLDWTGGLGLVDWTGGLEICRKYIRSYSQFVLRINYMLLYSTTKYDEEHPMGQAR